MTPFSPAFSVLVAEDDATLRGLVCRGLRGAGYTVTEAEDGQKAIEALEHKSFNVVLTDIIMPNREGVETIIEIRRRWPDIKIVAMSGGGRIDPTMILGLAHDFGANEILKKPFKLQALLDLLARFREVVAPKAS